MPTTAETLHDQHSVLLTLEQLARILDRSPEGLRISLATSHAEWASQINATKVKIGRRVYFRTLDIGRLIDERFLGPHA